MTYATPQRGAFSLLCTFSLCAISMLACDPQPSPDGNNGDDSTVPAATPLAEGAACDPAEDHCVLGTACCTECCEPENTPVCTATIGDACPLPDLAADQPRLEQSLVEEWKYFEEDDCAIVEGCILTGGWRRLLRFDLTTPNYGTADLRFGDPTGNPLFHYSECHDHFHFDGYAKYQLLNDAAQAVAQGHKQAFCLLDFEPWAEDAHPRPRYTCERQGISAGWADTYDSYLDCQWIDITDVPEGTYTVHASVNVDSVLPELDYTNNTAEASYTVVDAQDLPAVTEACPSRADGEGRDCGWTLAGNYACTPGAAVDVGCDGGCTDACVGDPILRVCEGSDNPCFSWQALASNDDGCGTTHCPVASVTCPSSGIVTVLTGSWKSNDGPATCDPVLE